MKCPECVSEGKKSIVYPGSSSTTLMGFQRYYDEDGVFHEHDPNDIQSHYSCGNGHQWTTHTQNKCPNCDWSEKIEPPEND